MLLVMGLFYLSNFSWWIYYYCFAIIFPRGWSLT